jgi:predicted nucleotidyltransferase
MKPSQAFEAHRTELRQIAARHGVLRPRIFGSVLRGEDTEDSDLDLLVDPTASTTLFTLASLQIEAEQLLGVPVDILTPKALPRRSRDRVLQEAMPV